MHSCWSKIRFRGMFGQIAVFQACICWLFLAGPFQGLIYEDYLLHPTTISVSFSTTCNLEQPHLVRRFQDRMQHTAAPRDTSKTSSWCRVESNPKVLQTHQPRSASAVNRYPS